MFVGVDGCSAGWVAVVVTDAGFAEARLFPDFDAVMVAFARAQIIGFDMPIGLTERAGRSADRAARAFLKGNASSVFNAPVRSALAATTYDEAKRITIEASGKGLSKQSYAILPKIREVDVHAADARVLEVHPEVSFRLMNRESPPGGKKTWGGLQARLGLLAAEGIRLPEKLGEADAAGIDDVVDAAAAAWSARRFAHGLARRFAGEVERDEIRGRVVAIWG